jgi:hypothetical protein
MNLHLGQKKFDKFYPHNFVSWGAAVA